MFQKVEIQQMARALARHAGARQAVIARNLAQADTPGYRSRDLPAFAALWREADAPLRATRPGHLQGGGRAMAIEAALSGAEPAPNGNSVSLEAEMVRAAETRAQHDMALAIQRSVSGSLRAALGRGR
jgi:flagellar basal-body rod protein FlgB